MADYEGATLYLYDYLTCGNCKKNFIFSKMQDFIQHKLFDCQDIPQKAMECHSCPKKFQTPWSLLQHAQNQHALKIFLECGPDVRGDGCTNIGRGHRDNHNLIPEPAASSLIATSQEKYKTLSSSLTIEKGRVKKLVSDIPEKNVKASAPVSKPSVDKVSCSCSSLTHSTVTGTSNTSTTSVAKPSLQTGATGTTTIVTPSVGKSPTHVPLQFIKSANLSQVRTTDMVLQKLPNLVQLGDRLQPVLTGPGKHSISILQPIRLPQGTVLSTPLPKMPFSTLPMSLPVAQIKPAHVSVQKEKPETPMTKQCEGSQSQDLAADTLPAKSKISVTVAQPSNTKDLSGNTSHPISPLPQRAISSVAKEASSDSSNENRPTNLPHLCAKPDESNSGADGSAPASQELQETTSPTQLQVCECPCCKAGKCCIRGVNIKPTTDIACPCGPKTTHDGSDAGASCSHISSCDSAVQVDQSDCPHNTERKKRKFEEEDTTENIIDEDGTEKDPDDTLICCDNQDCGVTIMPGTHEGLKKCCNAVVPKKRKRHMETKHRVKKRSSESSFSLPEENTIYIDFQPGANLPRGVSSGVTLSGADTHGTITVNTSPAGTQALAEDLENRSSLTLSIPVSYTRKQTCSSATCGRPPLGEECRCGCCPSMFQVKRDKKIKAGRRLSSSSGEYRKDLTAAGVQGASQGDGDLTVGVKSESAYGGAESSEDISTGPSLLLSSRKLGRTVTRAGVGKKRRYPTSRPFKCDQCDHAFNQRIHLKKHQSKHTGIKPFKCEQCDYSTVERSHLKVHIRVHTGEKPYKCSHCEYATAQNSTLKIHLKRHHGQEGGEDGSGGSHAPFSCSECGLEFDDEGPYLLHQQQLHNAAPLQTDSAVPSETVSLQHGLEDDHREGEEGELEQTSTEKSSA